MRPDRLFLAEIIGACERIVELTTGRTVEDIDSNRLVRDALLWNFTVLGEAVANVSEETKAVAPAVEWREPARTRNRIVHGYWSADVEILLAAAKADVPTFLAGVRELADALLADDQQA